MKISFRVKTYSRRFIKNFSLAFLLLFEFITFIVVITTTIIISFLSLIIVLINISYLKFKCIVLCAIVKRFTDKAVRYNCIRFRNLSEPNGRQSAVRKCSLARGFVVTISPQKTTENIFQPESSYTNGLSQVWICLLDWTVLEVLICKFFCIIQIKFQISSKSKFLQEEWYLFFTWLRLFVTSLTIVGNF